MIYWANLKFCTVILSTIFEWNRKCRWWRFSEKARICTNSGGGEKLSRQHGERLVLLIALTLFNAVCRNAFSGKWNKTKCFTLVEKHEIDSQPGVPSLIFHWTQLWCVNVCWCKVCVLYVYVSFVGVCLCTFE